MNPLPAIDPKRAILYLRVSSVEQEREGYGLPAQARACRDHAVREGYEVVGTYSDAGVSGTVTLDDRPGLSDALAAVYQFGAGTLVLAARDRLARDPFVAGEAKRAFTTAGARIVYADGGNGAEEGDLLLDDIRHAISAHERRVILARLKAGREAKLAQHPQSRAQGGKVPHGYRRTPTGLTIHPVAAAEVRRVFALVREGKPLRAVASILTEESGRPWRASTVEGIVKREDYKRSQPGRIVDARVWNQAQRALQGRRRRT